MYLVNWLGVGLASWRRSYFATKCYLLQGVDPDAPEEDEENEVEDADGDQEETDLL